MMNRPVFFRRALKLINAGNPSAVLTNLPTPGLTVASENPVYVQGNYNATAGTAAGVTAGETHRRRGDPRRLRHLALEQLE